MMEECGKDLSLGLEARRVPVIKSTFTDLAVDTSSSTAAAPPAAAAAAAAGPMKPRKNRRSKAHGKGGKGEDGDEDEDEAPVLPYPLFAYTVESLGNPVLRTSAACCQCVGDCRTNPECACRKRYPGDMPLLPGSERLTDYQLSSKVRLVVKWVGEYVEGQTGPGFGREASGEGEERSGEGGLGCRTHGLWQSCCLSGCGLVGVMMTRWLNGGCMAD
jgi:hypothetical protein